MMYRNAQGLTLGLGSDRAATTAKALESALQQASLLQDLQITSTQLGLVDAIRVAGQSLMASDRGANIQMFAPKAHVEGHRGMAIPLAQQQTVSVDITLVANGTVSAGVSLRPIDPTAVIPVNKLGSALNYVFGLGLVNVLAGAGGSLIATARRDCVLGLCVLDASANPEDVQIRSVTINNVELLAGPDGAAGEFGIECFGFDSTDDDGNVVGYPVRTNDVVNIDFWNYNAAPVNVYGGIFVLPVAP